MILLILLLAHLLLPAHQVEEMNCLREHPRVLDADFSLFNRYENQRVLETEDVTNHVALTSKRFKSGHSFTSLNNANLKNIANGINKHSRVTNKSYQLFFSPYIENIKMDINDTINLYQEILKTIMEVNSGPDRPLAGLYVGSQMIRYDEMLEALEFVFGSKENSAFPIGHGVLDCKIQFGIRSALKFLQRLNFLCCFVLPTKKQTPEDSADDVIRNCDKLQTTASALNITALIFCRVRYPTLGISPEGIVGSVLDFRRFWCRIVGEVVHNESHPQIVMSSAVDEPHKNYKDKDVNIADAKFHYGWWKRRDTNSYLLNAFVEKVEELQGGREPGICTPLCAKCSSHEECCEVTTCDSDSSFQPFEEEAPLNVCKAITTNCAPRIPLNNPYPTLPPNITSIYLSTTEPGESVFNSVNVSVSILGVLLLVVIVSVGVLIYHKRKIHMVLTKNEIKRFFDGSSSSQIESLENTEHMVEFVGDLPYERNLEVNRHSFKIYEDQILGSGAFGLVTKGRLGDDCVAVKTTLPGADKIYLKSLLLELKILTYLGRHEHIVNLRGVDTTKLTSGKLYLVLELCPLGSLLQFLRSNREGFRFHMDSLEPQTETDQSQLTCKHLLNWAIQITSAMTHLADKRVIHADIAARNILVFSRGEVKLTDFGLSRRLYEYANYVKKSQEPLPWRHMSVEALHDYNFSLKSDVWSFGVTLWEMFSLGNVPYPGYSLSHDFVELLLDGFRLNCPKNTHNLIYEVMSLCWTTDARERPSISVIHSYLTKALNEIYTQRLYILPADIQ